MQQNISHVFELIYSQQDNPGISNTPREIKKFYGIFASMLCCVAYAFFAIVYQALPGYCDKK